MCSRIKLRHTLRLLIAGTVMGCADGSGPDDVSSFVLHEPSSALLEGQSLRMSWDAVDHLGRPVPAEALEWSTEDPSTATVVDGVVAGVAPGITTITARLGRTARHAQVRVGFGELGTRGIGMRVQGTRARAVTAGHGTAFVQIGTEHDWALEEQSSRRFEIFSYPSLDFSLPPAESFGPLAEGLPTDTVLWVSILGDPVVGMGGFETRAPRVQADGTLSLFSDGNHALLRIRDPAHPHRMDVFVPAGRVELVVEEVVPPGPSGNPGTIRGYVTFEATGLRVEVAPEGVLRSLGPTSPPTARVYGEFEAPLREWQTGSVWYRVEGGTLSERTDFAGAALALVSGWEETWLTYHSVSALEPGTSVAAATLEVGLQLDPAAPEVLAVDDTGVGEFPILDQPGTWLLARLRDPRDAAPQADAWGWGVEGAVVIGEVVPPGDLRFGRVTGRLETTLARPTASDSLHILANFVLPIAPRCARSACEP